ncbi:MAG: 4a-hydroxytetrahydrobiopterin dehydratase [Actinomycetota bacterium]
MDAGNGGGPQALSEEQIEERLRVLPGWRRESGEILKWFKFPGFPEAIAFLQRIVEPAERLNHHPDIENHYNRVRIALHTWSVGAITEKDFALAAEIERVAGDRPPEVS